MYTPKSKFSSNLSEHRSNFTKNVFTIILIGISAECEITPYYDVIKGVNLDEKFRKIDFFKLVSDFDNFCTIDQSIVRTFKKKIKK